MFYFVFLCGCREQISSRRSRMAGKATDRSRSLHRISAPPVNSAAPTSSTRRSRSFTFSSSRLSIARNWTEQEMADDLYAPLYKYLDSTVYDSQKQHKQLVESYYTKHHEYFDRFTRYFETLERRNSIACNKHGPNCRLQHSASQWHLHPDPSDTRTSDWLTLGAVFFDEDGSEFL